MSTTRIKTGTDTKKNLKKERKMLRISNLGTITSMYTKYPATLKIIYRIN